MSNVMKPLWTPSTEQVRHANLTGFIERVNHRNNARVKTYWDLHKWSVEKVSDFWAAIWDYTGILCSQPYDTVVDDVNEFPGAKWFSGARLNFAENLLRRRDDTMALISRAEDNRRREVTYAQLHREVARVSEFLRASGVRPGDRVAGYLPNINEAAIAMLATTSLGAVWTCCGAELGPTAVLDRLGQVKPKILFTSNGYRYKGRHFDMLANVEMVLHGIPSVERTVMVNNGEEPSPTRIPASISFDELGELGSSYRIQFEQLPADHPVYIMFTSGTTGKPKCIVQGSGGILVNHLKETILHADLKQEDRISYITSPSWMMWNWLMSCLAVGSTLVLYDGNPNYPDWKTMWRLVQDEKITILGCSASYINYLRSINARPRGTYDLSSLREISQTGSPLSAEGFEWVYSSVKEDLHLNSISGGTDINGCFAGGVPTLPVYPGQLQGPGLGMKINAYDENGEPVVDTLGELVCEEPSPSMPLYFLNDHDNKRYKAAYFEYYSSRGKNVWRHGDYVMLHSDTGGITFYGRSDSVIKASGVRIGTSEIYNIVERLPEVADSLAIGQDWRGDQRIILFVKLAPKHHLSDDLKEKIRNALRKEASPKHVPAVIIEAPDIPYTHNMKKVEVVVSNILNNRPVTNRDSLTNPDSLRFYEKVVAELKQ